MTQKDNSLLKTGIALGVAAFTALAPITSSAADSYVARGFYNKDKELVGIVFDKGERDIDVWTDYAFKEKDLGTVDGSLDEFVSTLDGELTRVTKIGDEGVAYTLSGIRPYQGRGYFNLKPNYSIGPKGGGGERDASRDAGKSNDRDTGENAGER